LIAEVHQTPPTYPVHPKGKRARILLASVFGPYAQDDEFGSRAINPMELYHNQVTRAQGTFSLRMFHRSWGIMMIQANISAPCTVLDFPTREDFKRELSENQYDVVGITSIIVNIGKVREMCRIIREVSPGSQIVVGGHVTATPGIEQLIDADHIVKGEGIRWMRRYLGDDENAPIRHPEIVSGFRTRMMGIRTPEFKGRTAATVIPSVGCPMGCNFCTTSSFFGGKGKFFNFYNTGDELYEVMVGLEKTMKVSTFFVMDENFLLHRKRAMQLLNRMREGNKSWGLAVFSSANALRQYSMQELAELGISWVWMGLESPKSTYVKLDGTDTKQLTRELAQHGIRVQGSTIIGLEHHTRENIISEIEYAVEHNTDFHQFMLYTPVPGTPLYQQIKEEGRLLDDVDFADIHGQFKFNFKHTALSREDSKRFLDWAFWRDFERNGPSLFRMCRTMLQGWKRYKCFPDARVRRRFASEVSSLALGYAPALWAIEKEFGSVNPQIADQVRALRKEIAKEFGLRSRLAVAAFGPVALWSAKREAERLRAGHTYEPPTFLERTNWPTKPVPQFEPEPAALSEAVTA
jgi:radical SAM superfamily enzyme YgiQ (UPF0313 family)